ncbi:glycoside hydrolase family 31 protein [Piedraia hortae CBS 480.64]|uniref:Glycoside hydrolase family 31 protein n=1 Tax=Piedraia hortae CBS 480.64 TaxID=1314780 RepID=A0A6A7C903_9PEZI|nr:glycoside hydrolase family 31 protein [Piedraia hortae CBS 480.64]
MLAFSALLACLATASPVPSIATRQEGDLSSCPGYKAYNVAFTSSGLTADLTMAGSPCNTYGTDLTDLTLKVEYQNDQRLHVLIQDKANQVYQVPDFVFSRPESSGGSSNSSELIFQYNESPFSFSVHRRSNGQVLFDSSAASLVFESQYVRLRTSLPANPSLYGLGEHTDPFMLNTTGYKRTLWNRDAYTVPSGSNLYGDHPVYYDHRGANGTHAVFLLNSNGAEIDINKDGNGNQYLEYNLLGGVLDFYFVSGPSPVQVAQQYSEIVGKPAMMPYWGFGFHQCRYGMRDVYDVAEVVANYSKAGIPLETMWTDIDYMHLRRTFSLDEARFSLQRVRELVDTLHSRQQHYIVMVDPAVAYQDYPAFNKGVEMDIFVKNDNGSIYKGVVWPGVTAYPDWFHPQTQNYWNYEFNTFFNVETGIDIDALWIDMNEPSNFCGYPCLDPDAEAKSLGDPPRPPPVRLGSPRPIDGFPASFQPTCHAEVTFSVNATTFPGESILVFGSAITLGSNDEITNAAALGADNYPIWSAPIELPANAQIAYQYVRTSPQGYVYERTNRTLTTGGCGSTNLSVHDTITTTSPTKRSIGNEVGLPDRNLVTPPFTIPNAAGALSSKTMLTSILHYGNYTSYDVHNLYGSMMSSASYTSMSLRRPGVRPMIITRSTFPSSGRRVGHWLGDNASTWRHYLLSLTGLLQFTSLYQIPMTGSDVCGFAGNTNPTLCARWAMLGAFSPFYRNHNEFASIPQEFYRWEIVASAAKKAIGVRYQLLDYLYSAMEGQSREGKPALMPLWFAFPSDREAWGLEYQYLFGEAVMVAPVTEENGTEVEVYFPRGVWFDFWTGEQVGKGGWHTLTGVGFDEIPLFYRGGFVVPQRVTGANTTAELREVDFRLVVAPDENGEARGGLVLDDGVSVDGPVTRVGFTFEGGKLSVNGTFNYDPQVEVVEVVVLGQGGKTVKEKISLMGSGTVQI